MPTGKNSEGYPDPTASTAVGRVMREERTEARRIRPENDIASRIDRTMKVLRFVASLNGLRIRNRVIFEDEETGEVFR